MSPEVILSGLTPEEKTFVLIGIGTTTISNRRELWGGNLAEYAKQGRKIKAVMGAAAIQALKDLGSLYLENLGIQV